MSLNKIKRIFYVEDDLDIQEIAKISLESLGGFTLKICSSGKEALEEIDKFKPDLILLDVMMPEMDGPSLLAEIKKMPEYCEIPIIFLTAKLRDEETKYLRSIGAIAIISKPFDPMLLPDQIRTCWSQFSEQ